MHRVKICVHNKCMGFYEELTTASSHVFLSHKKNNEHFIDSTSIAAKTTLHIPMHPQMVSIISMNVNKTKLPATVHCRL